MHVLCHFYRSVASLIFRMNSKALSTPLIIKLLIAAFCCLFFESQILAQPSTSKLIFYRNTGAIKSATQCRIIHADSVLSSLKNAQAVILSLDPGTYDFRTEMTVDQTKGQAIQLATEAGKLHLVEVILARQSKNQNLPSSGYYFKLRPVEEKRKKSVLRRKVVKEMIKEALWEELLERYQ